jgi:DNA-binding winged helix-turn-helix (wHTH) protein
MTGAGDKVSQDKTLHFEPFRIELGKRQLWRGEERVKLRPMSLLVLAYLVSRAGEVVQAGEILQAVWAKTRVTRGAIRVCVREIRQALGDEASAPRYIETIGREGYRFIGEVVSSQYSVASTEKTAVQYPQLTTGNRALIWWAEKRNSLTCSTCLPEPCTVSGNSSLSRGKRGSAKRRWSRCFCRV